jgi:hypothetical protein
MPRSLTAVPITVLFLLSAAFALMGCGAQGTPASVPDGAGVAAPAASPQAPPTLMFLARDRRVAAGGCTTLDWEAGGVVRAYLDGRGIASKGSEHICPAQTTTYTLSVVLADGTEMTRTEVVAVDRKDGGEPTAGATLTPATATAAAAVARPSVAVGSATSPTAVATATAAVTPTAAVAVDFYPDNRVYEIGKDDSCTAVVWNTSGVTQVQLEREGLGRKDVGATGREEVCFTGRSIKLYLHYKLPGGREDAREVEIRRKS